MFLADNQAPMKSITFMLMTAKQKFQDNSLFLSTFNPSEFRPVYIYNICHRCMHLALFSTNNNSY